MTVVKADTIFWLNISIKNVLWKEELGLELNENWKKEIIWSWTLVELKIRMNNFRDQELTSENTRFYLKNIPSDHYAVNLNQ